ncbi:nitronate monooxygenase [Sphingomonas sp. CGMCC 1.13654]|uniref:Nitronate monooxygenase n=1 Tax=Sphingomonas chungangi TaxID=2683589 RepID=A0A838LBL7_9SPHN|nr:nitronate monooxygenase [Sphingomonas chungangi]MBA2936604.1 nitronate monooxygenase [Sphingomonas chungangi]MVW55989.1 nitronate monooxygenase [Sphingomonas chungangi]
MTATSLLDRIGVRLPIIQAPMAGTSSPAMAAAVSEAGGLGSIGVGAVDAGQARAMIAATRDGTSKPFNVNLFCHRPAIADAVVEGEWIARLRPEFETLGATPPAGLSEIYRSFVADEAMLRMLLDARPAVVSFHFGLPSNAALQALREAGILLLASATSLAEARAIEAAGIDAIVAQGWEAGGHRGVFDPDQPDDRLGTMALVRLLVRETRLPVIAAGGIMDGADIAATLDLGAAAAQLGTAFVGCDESLADEGYRAALASDAAHHTTMTRAISGRPARSLANRFTAIGATVPSGAIPAYPIAYDLGKALHAAGKARGEYGFGAQWAGQGAPLVRFMPAAELVATLARELEEARSRD